MRIGGEDPGSAVGSGNARTPPARRSSVAESGRSAPSFAAGNRAMIAPSSAERGMARAFATRTMGGICRSGRLGVQLDRPATARKPGMLEQVGDGDLGVRARNRDRRGGLQPGGDDGCFCSVGQGHAIDGTCQRSGRQVSGTRAGPER